MRRSLNCTRKPLWLDSRAVPQAADDGNQMATDNIPERKMQKPSGGRWNEMISGLRLPIVVAPMFLVSGPQLVVASGLHGLIGSFPTAYPRTLEELERWFQQIERGLAQQPAGSAPRTCNCHQAHLHAN
jgi:hypothetical protein